MESIDNLLSASLRVSRPVAACSRCRTAKVKCDGKLPACTACERSGKAESCTGSNDEFARGKERSYIGALETTLDKLERYLAHTKALDTTDPAKRDEMAACTILGTDNDLSEPVKPAHNGPSDRKEASDIDNLVGDFGFLSVNATSRDFHGFTSTMSFARLLLAASRTAEVSPAEAINLPPRYTVTSLLQSYLEGIYIFLPFFAETDLLTSVSTLFSEGGRYAKPIDHWTVRLVVAIAIVTAPPAKDDSHLKTARAHVSAALCYADDVLHPGSIGGIQAVLLLVQYSLLDAECFSSWQLTGFASRIMVDLGLHREPPPELTISKAALETRRRVFYCVYAIDRAISMVTGRPFSFTDDSVSVSLPESHNLSADSRYGSQLFLRSTQPSLYLFDIRRVQSALYQTLHKSGRSQWTPAIAKQYTDSVLTDVQSWFDSIPDTLPQNQLFLFRLELLYTQIVALAPSYRVPEMSLSSRMAIFELAINYVDQLHPIFRGSNVAIIFTVIDFQRLRYLVRQFLNVLGSDLDTLLAPSKSSLSGSNSAALPSGHPGSRLSSSVISPPISAFENATRAIRCLSGTLEIFSYARQRFGSSIANEAFDDLEGKIPTVNDRLRQKQQEHSVGSTASLYSSTQQRPSPIPLLAEEPRIRQSERTATPLKHSYGTQPLAAQSATAEAFLQDLPHTITYAPSANPKYLQEHQQEQSNNFSPLSLSPMYQAPLPTTQRRPRSMGYLPGVG